jgi:hypothetical protein
MKTKQLKINITVEGERGNGKSHAIDLLKRTLLQNGYVLIEDDVLEEKFIERYEGKFLNIGEQKHNVTS